MDKREAENLRVKRSIVNAFFALLKEKDMENISVSEVTRNAKVSRMAYYRNFNTKKDIIEFYVDDILTDMMALLGQDFDFWSPEYGRAFFETMKKHRERVLMLNQIGLSGLFLDKFTATNEELAGDMPSNSIERYKLYYVAGASYNATIHWLKSGCKESVEEMAKNLADFVDIYAHAAARHGNKSIV